MTLQILRWYGCFCAPQKVKTPPASSAVVTDDNRAIVCPWRCHALCLEFTRPIIPHVNKGSLVVSGSFLRTYRRGSLWNWSRCVFFPLKLVPGLHTQCYYHHGWKRLGFISGLIIELLVFLWSTVFFLRGNKKTCPLSCFSSLMWRTVSATEEGGGWAIGLVHPETERMCRV